MVHWEFTKTANSVMVQKPFSKPSQIATRFSLAGGGNTIAAIDEYGLTKKISYISTAGGALIEFLMGKKLPGVVALENAAETKKVYAVPTFKYSVFLSFLFLLLLLCNPNRKITIVTTSTS